MFIYGSGQPSQVAIYAGVPESMTSKFRAGDWVNAALAEVKGKGGGRPTFAGVRQ